jgi:hypothetical protein
MIKLLIVFIVAATATVGSGYADEQTQIPGLTYQCPYPLTTLGELPAGWKVKELKGSAVMHGPYMLPGGITFTFTTPYYVLEPDMAPHSTYILEPGFDVTKLKSDPRRYTLPSILRGEMEKLRESSADLGKIADNIEQLRQYLRTQNARQETGQRLPDSKQGARKATKP